MNWDLVSYLEDNIKNLRESGSFELTGECPVCGKSIDHFYVHIGQDMKWGKFNCFKCGVSGNIWRLLSIIEGISLTKARRLFSKEIMTAFRSRPKELVRKKRLERIQANLPEDFIPITTKRPKYVVERGISLSLARKYQLGYCRKGQYSNRLVFPIRCPLGQSFTTRAMWETNKRKYLSGPGVGQLIFGWDQAFLNNPKQLVISEGPIDVLGLSKLGISSVAFMGHNTRGQATERKINLIKRTGVEVIVCYDSDSILEGADLADQFQGKVAILASGDPGDCSKELIQAIQNPVTSTKARLISRKKQALLLSNT